MLPPARPAQPLPPAFQQPPQTIPSTIQVQDNIFPFLSLGIKVIFVTATLLNYIQFEFYKIQK